MRQGVLRAAPGVAAAPLASTPSIASSSLSLAAMDASVQAFQAALGRFAEVQAILEMVQAVAWQLSGVPDEAASGAPLQRHELDAPGRAVGQRDALAAFAALLKAAPAPLRLVARA